MKKDKRPKPWGNRCPCSAFDAIDDRGRDLANLYDAQADKVKRLKEELAFEQSLLPLLQVQLTEYVERVAGESKFVPELPKIYDASIRYYLKALAEGWEKLAKRGATNEEVFKQLCHSGNFISPDHRYRYRLVEKVPEIYLADLYGDRDKLLVKGRNEVIAEVRRIMGIPQPVKVEGTGARSQGTEKKKAARKPVRSTSPKAAKSNSGPAVPVGSASEIGALKDKGPVKPEGWARAWKIAARFPE